MTKAKFTTCRLEHARWFVVVFFVVFLVVLFSLSSQAAVPANLTGDAFNRDMEACAECATGIHRDNYVRGAQNMNDLRINVNVFLDENGQNPLQQITTAAEPNSPYSAIGRVTTETAVRLSQRDPQPPHEDRMVTDRIVSTGFMIGPCLMLTNFHAVFGNVDTQVDTNINADPADQHFHYVKFEIGTGSDHRVLRGRAIRWGNFSTNSQNGDWAVVQLNECVGRNPRIGWMRPTPLQTGRQNVPASIAGFANGSTTLSGQRRCLIRSVGAYIQHDCASLPGSSGSPLIVSQDGSARVAALNGSVDSLTSAPLDHFDDRHSNWAIPIESIFVQTDLQQLIDAEIANSSGTATTNT